jgi:hypothetical protein
MLPEAMADFTDALAVRSKKKDTFKEIIMTHSYLF